MSNSKFVMIFAAALAWPAISATAQGFGEMDFGERNAQTVLVIKSDGSSVITNQSTQSRQMLEMQIFSWERFSKMEEGSDEEDANPAAAAGATKPKPLTNEELTAKVREMYQQRSESDEEEAMPVEVGTVDVSSNSVRLVTTRSFASLKDLLSQSPYSWGPNALMFDRARAELDTNHSFRLTFTSNPQITRYAKSAARRWKSAKINSEWKLVLPGKILSSGLPNTQDHATWLSLDAEKPETLDAAVKLTGTTLTIIAEPAGLKLDEPLESKKLVRTSRRPNQSEPDLPITDATGGFLAEPQSITLSTAHYFPEAEKYLSERMLPSAMMFGSTGTVVSAKLFPPKNRELRNVSDIKVKSAKDDKGRPISISSGADDNEEGYSDYVRYTSNDSENGGAMTIQLRLGLPAPDAKAIDAIEAEAVALTVGSWKELVLTNVQADTNKPIDLGEVLPGAKLIVKKISGHKPQKRVDATLEGPKEISQLEVKIKLSARRGGQSNMNERRLTKSGVKTVRNFTIESYEYEMGNAAEETPLTLVVRYPQDLKRERVRFTLSALDLL